MNFGSGHTKAWKDIWGCGQGIGSIDKIQPAGELVSVSSANTKRRVSVCCTRRDGLRSLRTGPCGRFIVEVRGVTSTLGAWISQNTGFLKDAGVQSHHSVSLGYEPWWHLDFVEVPSICISFSKY